MATDYVKLAKRVAGGTLSRPTNVPKARYASRQFQYFADESDTFNDVYARYSSDYVEARMQGLNPDDPFEWNWTHMRLADVVKTSAAMSKYFDDFKFALIDDRSIEYITPGSKIETMGSTWIAMNPVNISGADGQVLIRRCNVTWNFYDEDRNIIKEPMIVESQEARASAIDPQEVIRITTGYFNIICQHNEYTRQLDVNSRLLFGRNVYRIQGFSDFHQEFTGDYDSVHLLEFAAYYEEPNLEIDDMENYIAGGLKVDWEDEKPSDRLL